jgi:hypothetical protein
MRVFVSRGRNPSMAGSTTTRPAGRVSARCLLALFGLVAFPAAALAMPDPSAFVAMSPDVPTQVLALSDRMILGGALLILLGMLTGLAAAMWRDILRPGRRP